MNKNELLFTKWGATEKLIATVEPENAADKELVWECEGYGGSVEQDGTVTASYYD